MGGSNTESWEGRSQRQVTEIEGGRGGRGQKQREVRGMKERRKG